MKDGDLVRKILGIRVTWSKDNIRLDQETYIHQMLSDFGLEGINGRETPLVQVQTLTKNHHYYENTIIPHSGIISEG